MTEPSAPGQYDSEFWREYLTKGDPLERAGRRFFRLLPHSPRCRMCAAPFAGAAAPVMRLMGKRPSEANPNMCGSCFTFMSRHKGGAEVTGSMLFADIRGSTSLAERMSNSEFRSLLDRFYSVTSEAVFAHDGMVDKFVGDELVAIFAPLLSGERHAERAVEAGTQLLRATGHADAQGPWVPVGAGVHTGPAWFGAVGEGARVELTAVGDAVNTAARLAAAAQAGEVIVSVAAAEAAGLDPELERTALKLKGKEQPTEVVRLRVGPV